MSLVQQGPPHDLTGVPPSAVEPELIRKERAAVRALLELVEERATAEAAVARAKAEGDASADTHYRQARQALAEKIGSLEEYARQSDEQKRRAVVDAAIAGEAKAKADYGRDSRRIAAEFENARERAGAVHHKEKTEAAAGFDAGERDAARELARALRPVDDADKLVTSYQDRLAFYFEENRRLKLPDAPTKPTRESYKFDNPADALFERLTKVEKPLKLLEGLFFPKLLKGSRLAWVFVLVFLALIGPFVWLLGDWAYGALGASCATIAAGLGLKVWLTKLSKAQVSTLYYPLVQNVTDARAFADHIRATAETKAKDQRALVAKRRDEAIQQAKAKHAKTVKTAENVRDERLREINEVYAKRMVDIQTKQQVDLRQAIEAHEARQAEIRAQAESGPRKLDEKYEALKEKIRARHASAWQEMADRWLEGMARVSDDLAEVVRQADAIGPAWDAPGWPDRPAPTAVPSTIRYGSFPLALADLPGGLPADPRLRDGVRERFDLPALRPFPGLGNLVIEAPAAGRASAVTVLQSSMLRLLTSLPPGAVRFTIVDPVGIGRNFGAFMHMADYDDALVNGQVWTDPRQIDERLAELGAHMERVTQKYLRNEYASIEEYNAAAGEVAEPYRVLVVADFPAGFEERTISRLAAIASSGVPCGVLTLVALDPDKPLPPGITRDDLRASALTLDWDGARLTRDDPDFDRFPLAPDAMPPAELTTRLVQRSASAARDARRVEVPFEYIAPAADAWWSADSRAGIDVALGKAAATKRQNLMLGKGTSQHVLVAGRTGSGKSTLLHALITNLALNYSPDEVELYLIDFKKGVEFKVYATRELPHAAVVAIESEREFGISVLQRLDAEMRSRGDRFRDAGVQDINGFRNLPDAPPLPRVLLIVDEFQEFFVEEDKLAQEAALLLDRLVRQGRAFGVHIILGSQTLGGAFTLARTTLGQMAVRVALQCSETDAHLILSEQNNAAQLLSRPGEAVYNDANGMAEGNHFFQVVWLSDARREEYLRKLADRAREHPPKLKRTRIVFEGDAPADLSKNPKLVALLDAPSWPPSPRSTITWLGDPVAIKEPTSALFRRQGGSHLLIVGQNEGHALGVLTASLIGLAAQYPPSTSDTVRSGAKFYVLDGTPEDHPRAEFLADLAGALPHPSERGSLRDVGRILGIVAEEVARRGQPDSPDGPELFLLIHDLPRFRDLRKREDDFSFSRRDDDASPADKLRAVIREGPALGVHVLTWCDNLNNLQRSFDNQALREFEMRVLFQMSANDSGHLLDAPWASKLGPLRALFASEEQSRLEKFRPYGVPDEGWLRDVADRLNARPRPEIVSG